MVKAQEEDAAIEVLRKFVQRWGSVLAVAGVGTGIYYDHRQEVTDIRKDLEAVRKVCDARNVQSESFHAVGNDGFANPQTRLALERNVQDILHRAADGVLRDVRRHLDRLYDNNPNLKRPQGD